MRNVSDKSCRQNQNTHFVFSNIFPKILSFMRKCGKNVVEGDRPQMTIWGMRISCWITKATNTHSGCVVSIVARTRLNVTLYVHCLSFVSSCAQLHTAGVRVQRSMGLDVDRRNTFGNGRCDDREPSVGQQSEGSAIMRVQITAAEHEHGVRRW